MLRSSADLTTGTASDPLTPAHLVCNRLGAFATQVDLHANVLRFTNLDIALPFLQGSDLPPAARMLAEEGTICELGLQEMC